MLDRAKEAIDKPLAFLQNARDDVDAFAALAPILPDVARPEQWLVQVGT